MSSGVMGNVGRAFSGVGVIGLILAFRLGVFGVVIGSSTPSSSEGMAAFDLTAQEAQAYRSCRLDLTHVNLSYRGDLSTFCSCFAKRATGDLNNDYKIKAVSYYRAYARTQTAPSNPESYFPVASYEGSYNSADEAARAVRRAGNACVESAGEDGRGSYRTRRY